MSRDDLLIRDRAGCIWGIGLAFLGTGAILTGMLLGEVEGMPAGGWLIAAWVIAASHTAAGAWMVLAHPNVRVRRSADGRSLRIVRHWPFVRRPRDIPLDQIHSAVVRIGEDSDGDTLYGLELVLRTGERLSVLSVDYHTREPIDEALARLERWSGGRMDVRSRRGPRSLIQPG